MIQIHHRVCVYAQGVFAVKEPLSSRRILVFPKVCSNSRLVVQVARPFKMLPALKPSNALGKVKFSEQKQ